MVQRMISYAQNHEDVVLARCFRGQASGFYIDVGAWDPDNDSVTRHFYDNGWSGINIEPNSTYYDKLAKARKRDINLQVVISTANTEVVDFIQCEGSGLSGLSGLVDANGITSAGFVAHTKQVKVAKLCDIVETYARRSVDFLKIDVEGAEKQVLESAEWKGFRPRIIVVEAIKPLTHEYNWFEWEGILLSNNYQFALFDGLNRFYFRSEEPSLRQPLSIPCNILDNYVSHSFAILENKVLKNKL